MRASITTALLLAWLHAGADTADPYYTGNAFSPYPPGCVTLLSQQRELYGDNVVRFWSGSMWLDVVHEVESGGNYRNVGLVHIDLFRVGCAEPDRSVIVAEFRLPQEWDDPRNAQLVLPTVSGSYAWDPVPFEFRAEPNGWGRTLQQEAITRQAFGDYTGGWDDARRFIWRYVLDVGPAGVGWGADFMVDYYNSRLGLQLGRNDGWGNLSIEVPATHEVLEPNPVLPLNGRLSGAWIEPGAVDQGLVLSFSSPVPPAGQPAADAARSDLVVFLTWFTFDADGDPLWLAGSARFAPGASEVEVPLVHAAGGGFLDSRAAERRTVGSLRLKARQCNEIDVEYDLDNAGLGSGDLQLQRMEALEVAGYPCRDYLARLASLPPAPDN